MANKRVTQRLAAAINTFSAVGLSGYGSLALAGAKVGDRVVSIFGAPTAGGAFFAKAPGVDFEATISVAGQIKQLTEADLSADTLVFQLQFSPASVY